MPTIAVLDYGSGNLHSVSRALARVGGDPIVTGTDSEVGAADGLVIPGVGHFGACMRAICDRGLDETIRSFCVGERPVFGVCVGMQVLFEGSEEDAEVGLGLFDGTSRKLPDDVKVPHMGWDTVTWTAPHPYIAGIPDDARFYFVHSYAPSVDADVTVGVNDYGRASSAAVARRNVFATQFHPEKSGEAGLEVYQRFVKDVAAR